MAREVRQEVERPTQRFGNGWKIRQKVGKPTLRFGRSRETHPNVREGSGVPLGGPGGVRRSTRRSERGRKVRQEVGRDQEAHQRSWRCQ